MKKAVSSVAVLALAAAMIFSAGCKKKQPEMQQQPQGGQMGMPTKVETVLNVPDGVKKKWKAVKLNLTDKNSNKSQIITAEIGKESAIAGTNLKVFVETFLPAFKMDGGTITSVSNDQTTNPAVKLIVTEKGQEVFKGWLFELYPSVHPFTHAQYTMTLAGYVKK